MLRLLAEAVDGTSAEGRGLFSAVVIGSFFGLTERLLRSEQRKVGFN